jgi:membrane protease YdiL (CAAX protease family)
MRYDTTLPDTTSPNQPPASIPPPPLPDVTARPIAHWLHTCGLFALLLLSTWATHGRANDAARQHVARIPSYLVSIGLEWILLALVIAGIYRRRDFLRAAFLNRAISSVQSVGLGIVVYIMGFMAVIVTGAALYYTPLVRQRNEAVVLAMLPHTPLQFLVWFGVSLTAGICEELIFRGYLLRQLTAWTQRPILAIFLAALLFGSVHLYEGLGAILPLAALAVVYGFAVRYFKGDLRAVIIAHTLQDFLVAFIALARPFLDHYQHKP